LETLRTLRFITALQKRIDFLYLGFENIEAMQKLPVVLILSFLFVNFTFSQRSSDNDPLKSFISPPPVYQPHVWWHWMGNNITREGITADLEAMKESGIAGATIFNVSSNADKGGFFKNSYTTE
jgi:hypothetical protein